MSLSKLVIHQFRNINHAELTFNNKINIIVGDNGSGKTSLLETIYFLGLGRSFRSHLTSRIVQHDHKEFTIFSEVMQANLATPIGLQKSKNGDTTLKINGAIAKKLSDLTHYLPIQLITPESSTLLSGSPKNRRAFLDWGVFYHDPLFYHNWARIKRLLKQRNAALKQCKTYNELQLWDNELCLLSEKISTQRQAYFEQLLVLIKSTLNDFLPDFDISCQFFCGWDRNNKSLAEYLRDNFPRDSQLGYTTAGPQKADIRFKIGAFPVADVLSRGQLKLFVYALQLAQGLFLNSIDKKQCIFLIDDFSSELDQNKQQILAKHIAESGAQLFITVIEPDNIDKLFTQKNSVFHVEHGQITEQLEN
ncbi:DNA replication/repair protein RecF [Psychromonas sp. psych-6C06]|uniref:DNA replication/repair protein RecF n=1 Tax=Psychromonas sp. psych-6C06 TaxID=2058089 RepID=UPI000C340E7F|nr:DNA replication/repair protein RecF [Psychromonas sp. psych-6C06]PKF60743.1 DNA replication/repair protein RecF [Psychromonas sp. psych-6C06]